MRPSVTNPVRTLRWPWGASRCLRFCLKTLGTKKKVEGMRTFEAWETQTVYCVLLDRGGTQRFNQFYIERVRKSRWRQYKCCLIVSWWWNSMIGRRNVKFDKDVNYIYIHKHFTYRILLLKIYMWLCKTVCSVQQV